MPYVFGFLVLANLALFTYFWFMPPKDNNGTLNEVRASIDKPIVFVNNTVNIPPEILNQGMKNQNVDSQNMSGQSLATQENP